MPSKFRMLKTLPGRYKDLVYVNTAEECEKFLPRLEAQLQSLPFLGFDCEWLSSDMIDQKTSKVESEEEWQALHKVSLLQLASLDGLVALLHLCHFTPPQRLRNLLQDERIMKLGVGIENDVVRLKNDHDLDVASFLDLRHLHTQLKRKLGQTQPGNNGLKSMTRQFFCLSPPNVDWKTDWNAPELSYTAEEYAARDAMLGVHNFVALVSHLAKEDAGLLGPPSLEDDPKDPLLERTFCEAATELGQTYLNVVYRETMAPKKKKDQNVAEKTTDVSEAEKELANVKIGDAETDVNKTTGDKIAQKSNDIAKRNRVAKTSPLYDSCRLYAPDGDLLAFISRRKALWYLRKDRAGLTCGNVEGLTRKLGPNEATPEVAITLNFEPSARSNIPLELDVSRNKRDNVCVVCGSTERRYVRKYIVPHGYRVHFPDEYKNYNSHDLLLICIFCARKYERSEKVARQRLADMCDCPVNVHQVTSVDTKRRLKLKYIASALKHARVPGSKIPENRRTQLELELKSLLSLEGKEMGDCECTEELLDSLTSLEKLREDGIFARHEKAVVDCFQKKYNAKGIWELEKYWRHNFVDCMKPGFLPQAWSVDRDSAEFFNDN